MRNRERDGEVREALQDAGWRVLTVWECSVRKMPVDSLIDCIILWLKSEDPMGQISPTSPG
jgi:DNA mismatch endonuclease (patch repair protein)